MGLAGYSFVISALYATVTLVAHDLAAALTILFVALLLLPHWRWGRR